MLTRIQRHVSTTRRKIINNGLFANGKSFNEEERGIRLELEALDAFIYLNQSVMAPQRLVWPKQHQMSGHAC